MCHLPLFRNRITSEDGLKASTMLREYRRVVTLSVLISVPVILASRVSLVTKECIRRTQVSEFKLIKFGTS